MADVSTPPRGTRPARGAVPSPGAVQGTPARRESLGARKIERLIRERDQVCYHYNPYLS